jgi:DNA-binding NarL/FixJ family response regulator
MERALSTVASPEYYFPVPHLYWITHNKRFHLKNNDLTGVEITFLKFCATAKSYKEIADKMKMTQSKIDHIRDALFQKLEIQNRAALTLVAVKNGLAVIVIAE